MKKLLLICLFLIISVLRIGVVHSTAIVQSMHSDSAIIPLTFSIPIDNNAVGEKTESIVLLRILEKYLLNTPASSIEIILEKLFYIKCSIHRAQVLTHLSQALFCQFLL